MESSRRRPPPFFLGSLLLFLLTFPTCTCLAFQQTPDCADSDAVHDGSNYRSFASSERRSHHTITVSGLNHAVIQPHRVPGDKCTNSDVVINQGATGRLPNGIPTYTVEIMNQCPSGCSISGIHVRCGWFSSATMVNPLVFKRLAYNDCLVNNGRPLLSGRVLSFKYATTFPYPLVVAKVHC